MQPIYAKAKALDYWYDLHARTVFMVMLSILLVSFAAYMFFMVSSLSSGVAYQQIKREVANTEFRVANLEAERIARMKAVDLAFAKERGFIEVSPTRYIASADTGEKFTMRDTRE
jgi:uncharacterized membrane protein (DUF4010 family)